MDQAQILSVMVTALVTAVASALVSNTLGRSLTKRLDEGERKRDAAREEARLRQDEIVRRLGLIEDANRSLLRAEIIRMHRKGVASNSATLEDKEYMDRTYDSYHKLGGNGIGTNLHDEYMALPTSK